MSTTSTRIEEKAVSRRVGPVRRGLQRIFLGWTVLFVLCILFQVFMAGAGIFASAEWFKWHGTLGSLLVLVALLVLILSLVSGLPASVKWLSALLVLLVVFQPLWIFGMPKWGLPLLSAMHPVSALFIFTIPLYLIFRSRRAMHATAAVEQSTLH